MKFFSNTTTKGKRTKQANSDISKDINDNIDRLKNDFADDSDLVIHRFKLGNVSGLVCANIYIKSLVDRNTINGLSVALNKLKCECINGESDINVDELMN